MMNQRMGYAAKNRVSTVIWKLLLMGIVICAFTAIFAKAVIGEEKSELTKEQYEVLEQESVQEIRDVLCANYLSNSGVMLTKIAEQGKPYIYEIQIHHKGLERLSAEQKKELCSVAADRLSDIWNTDRECVLMPLGMSVNADSSLTLQYELLPCDKIASKNR